MLIIVYRGLVGTHQVALDALDPFVSAQIEGMHIFVD